MATWLTRVGASLGLSLALVALGPAPAIAQHSVCLNCIDPASPALPASGAWFTPEEPGTGFLLNVQGSRIGGTWFGFDEAGNPQWYLIAGDLVRGSSETGEGPWLAEVTITSYQGGACLGCDYRNANESPGPELRIEFYARNAARFSVDGQEWRKLETLTFGTEALQLFAPSVTYPVPDLRGIWLFVVRPPGTPPGSDGWAYSIIAHTRGGGPVISTGGGVAVASFYRTKFGPGDDSPVVSFGCSRDRDGPGLTCRVTRRFSIFSGIGSTTDTYYTLKLEDIGATRMKGEASDGGTIEAFRIGFD